MDSKLYIVYKDLPVRLNKENSILLAFKEITMGVQTIYETCKKLGFCLHISKYGREHASCVYTYTCSINVFVKCVFIIFE